MNDQVIVELQRLMTKHGGVLPPAAIVDAARPVDSPLHDHFEWEDTAAAEKWRLHQARQLLRVVVRYEDRGSDPVLHRVYVSLEDDRKNEGGGYRAMVDVLSDEYLRTQLLEQAKKDLLRFREKYARLTELANIFAAIDDLDVPTPEPTSSSDATA